MLAASAPPWDLFPSASPLRDPLHPRALSQISPLTNLEKPCVLGLTLCASWLTAGLPLAADPMSASEGHAGVSSDPPQAPVSERLSFGPLEKHPPFSP